MSACSLLLLSVIRPSTEYGCEVVRVRLMLLQSVVLGGGMKILGCSSKTCNEAVRGDMGLDRLKSHRDKNGGTS